MNRKDFGSYYAMWKNSRPIVFRKSLTMSGMRWRGLMEASNITSNSITAGGSILVRGSESSL